jgi:peroxiredoxin
VNAGDPAPALAGATATGEAFDLAAPRAKPALVEFHRGSWCPNCAGRLHELASRWDEFVSSDLDVVAVVCQKRSALARWIVSHPLPFPILADEDRGNAKRWGVYVAISYDSVHMARPASFVVDRSGIVRYARIARHQLDPAPLAEILAAAARSARISKEAS